MTMTIAFAFALLGVAPETIFNNFGEHLSIYLGGISTIVLLSHAVNTFPPPNNPYGKWLLGVVQFAVGQRMQAKETVGTPTTTSDSSTGIITKTP